ncbi:MAG: response regulator [Gemmatimonadota bacterium]
MPLRSSTGPLWHTLVVDREPVVRQVLRRLLVAQGHVVLEAESGTEALALATSPLRRIDLLITETRLEGLAGLVLAHAIKAIHAALAVCIVAADAPPESLALPRAWAWLRKPVPVTEFDRVIADLLRRRDEVVAEVA